MVMEQLVGGRTASLCKGCGSYIHDQYILRVSPDLEWHAACLRCVECQTLLDDKCTCFVRNGKTYCKNDYVRLFAAKCSSCNQIFSPKDLVMRAKECIFHVDCFRCQVCSRRLVSGDEFALKNGNIYCRDDLRCKVTCKDEIEQPPLSPGCSEDNVLVKVDKDPKRREGKPTRVRTVLTEKQLHTLRTCYNANPRPDALMKEQMVEMTGLSPRVIRVWFQNKRCKDKKREIYLRQIQEASKEGRQLTGVLPAVQGVHMIAAPPVRHGLTTGSVSGAPPTTAGGGIQPPALSVEPVSISSFQPPWKMFHELAHQPDIDASSAQYHALYSQMHGYGAAPPPPSVHGSPHDDARLTMDSVTSGRTTSSVKYEPDAGSDSYVSYLESDDSLTTASP